MGNDVNYKKGLSEEFFKEQIQRLRNNYGDSAYPTESVKALWGLLRHVSQNRFHQAINRILAENVSIKYPPGIDRIERALENVREETWAEQKEKVNKEFFEAVDGTKASLEQVSKTMNKILTDINKG